MTAIGTRQRRRPRHARALRRGTIAAAVGAAVCGSLGVVGSGVAAATTWYPVPENGAPGGLVLETSTRSLSVPDLQPGHPAYWQVHTVVDRDEPIRTTVQLHRDGALVEHPDGLRLTVSACEEPWQGLDATPICEGGSIPGDAVVSADPSTPRSVDAVPVPVVDPDADGETWLLVELAIADSARAAADDDLMGLTATVGLGVTASADEPIDGHPEAAEPDPGPHSDPVGRAPTSGAGLLASTGAGFAAPVLLAAALVLTGVAVRLRRSATGRPQRPSPELPGDPR
ncbi:hypothetical protein [Curtobacterium caseinilyticum]|uniref:Uncharacterized protein n=1 Tax=Curtobacterium caseinilyticum TaxID=3055137 RepID=A0ABT7TTI7_9MICO|nr:hypothetical protein [Curtobacterium caseinilyticum]MDM7892926.1 hypothetical protein [Curtobacterium caseinilyticum]